MILFAYKCPVCQNAHQVEGQIQGWSKKHTEIKLRLKIMISPRQRVDGDKLFCSEKCYNKYRTDQRKASAAYDKIMGVYGR